MKKCDQKVLLIFQDLIGRERARLEEFEGMIIRKKEKLNNENRCKGLDKNIYAEIACLEARKAECLENIRRWEKNEA